MDQPMRDFTDLLLRRGVVSLDQLSEATTVSRDNDIPIGDALVQLGYAEANAVYQALAEFHKLDPPMAHRDIKPANVLLSDSGKGILTFKICFSTIYDNKCINK